MLQNAELSLIRAKAKIMKKKKRSNKKTTFTQTLDVAKMERRLRSEFALVWTAEKRDENTRLL